MKFLLKKERVFFFRGSTLQVFGQCGGAKCGLGFAKTIFWGIRIWQNLGGFPARRKGSGE
ncbi:MAG: hypothetical protein CO088_01645 [Candidatus Yonathbacteria bacterium CG_4_9_14_0_8_um_filter_46_47]|uniref:Uncharacterized protein n=1 Tax=Candidatus Yonathbacteria bacterium CG_4_9_14_0_8_um_filter_46_47 TaxID=1975106 RepID=A0A2M8D8C2_9BACT|nr:MAG: hypothetical protein CO088_01645 [Candidatus Yonathbacteria bacterium CG_4_9_14_0_8_um_filter_46_47]PJC67716.1 MAG: hypothetical protein CO016_00500 [Candidatus Yonathbacteria bacterium CG_4_8_14_3_um_filter_46_25]